jgi:hypothetical protein
MWCSVNRLVNSLLVYCPVPIAGRSGPFSAPPELTGLMGRVSSAGDNAAMESFFSLLQKNVDNRRRRWRTRSQLR